MESKTKTKTRENAPMILAKPQKANGNSQDDSKIGPYLLVCLQNPEGRTEHEPLVDHSLDTPDLTKQTTDNPISDRNDPSYQPHNTPLLGANSRLPGYTPAQ